MRTWRVISVAIVTASATAAVMNVSSATGEPAASLASFEDFQFVATTDPAGTRAMLGGTVAAVFTTNARTVRITSPQRTVRESTTSRSVVLNVRIRRLPSWDPWHPQMVSQAWFREWLPKAVQDTGPDLVDYAMRYVTGAPANPPLEGDADYGPLVNGLRQEGADYNDYLQETVFYRNDESTAADDEYSAPEAAMARSLDCSGYVRMVFGYRMGWPLKRFDSRSHPVLGIPRRAVGMAAAVAGVEIVSRTGDVNPGPTALARLAPGDLVFFDANDDDGDAIDHVGIYLGVDDGVDAPGAPDESPYHRFLSSRKTVNGPTLGDQGGWSVLNRSGSLYSTSFRSARRL